MDVNIKQLLEINLKKGEKGENWLLAKKPFGGNSCASCEAYIGDLNENRDYIPWNKLRESAERQYRLGNGFSKILQENVNINTTKPDLAITQFAQTNYNSTSSTEIKRNKAGNDHILPKIRSKQVHEKKEDTGNNIKIVLTKQNLSMEIPEFYENEDDMDIKNEEQKVLKIYKVKKNKEDFLKTEM